MATIKKYVTGTDAHEVLQGLVGTNQVTLDFGDNPASSGDVVQALKVRKGFFVHSVVARVIEGEGSDIEIEVGSTADPKGYIKELSVENPKTITLNSEWWSGYFYEQDSTVDVKLNGNLTKCIVQIIILYTVNPV